MVQNPYLTADYLRVARESTLPGRLLATVLPAITTALAMVIAGEGAFAWTAASGSVYVAGGAGHAARVGVALAGAMALVAYTQGVRGADRGLADLHPVVPRPYVAARRRATARAAVPWLAGAWPMLWPMHGNPALMGQAAILVLGAWIAGQAAGLALALAAPSLGQSASLAPLLDAVRGANPRPQAALIWAPGVALAIAGASVVVGAYGLAAGGAGLGALAVPFATAALVWRLRPTARDLCAIPAVLADVDAAWAAVDAEDEGRRVYMEGPVRWLPASTRTEVLRVLRHGWREHRVLLSGSWALVALCVVASFAREALALPLLVATFVVIGSLGPRMARADPAWLDVALPRGGVAAGRAVAVGLWLAAGGLVPLVVLALRGSSGLALVALLTGAVLAAAAGRGSPLAYAGTSLAALAVSLGVLGGFA